MKLAALAVSIVSLFALGACGDTATERAATGGLGGAVVAGPAGRSSAEPWAPPPPSEIRRRPLCDG